MNFRVAVIWVSTSVLLFSCKDKNEPGPVIPVDTTTTLQIKYSCYWNDELFQLQQPYTDDFGTIFRIDLLKQYFSFLQLRKQDGSYELVEDFDLIDFASPVTRTYTMPAGRYLGMDLGLGIPANYNSGQDPSQYPSSNPLSVAGSQGMFWTWNTGYIFSKFEGKCDTTGTPGLPLL
ncbi:MAG: MbnP family protein, partial [Flavobacteriales bacterium]